MVNKGGRPPSKEPRSGGSGRADSTDASRTAASKGANSGLQTKKANGLRRGPETPDSKPLRNQKAVDGGGMGKKSDAGKKHALARPSHVNKAPSPAESTIIRTHTHWDYVMMEMKWMAVDFMQERRWKMAAAAHAAHWATKAVAAKAPAIEADSGSMKRTPATPGATGVETIHAADPLPTTTAAADPKAEAPADGKAKAAKGTASEKAKEGEVGEPQETGKADVAAVAAADGGSEALAKKVDSGGATAAEEEPQANGDLAEAPAAATASSTAGATGGSKAGEAQPGAEPEAAKQDRAGEEDTGPSGKELWGSGCMDWCVAYHCLPELTKLLKLKIAEIDDRRALTQDLKVFEYRLDYDAACASVALAHQVAKEEAIRQAAQQELRLAEAQLAAEEEARKNKRLKKKTSKAGLELEEDTDVQNKKLASISLIGAPGQSKPPRPSHLPSTGALAPGMTAMAPGSVMHHGVKQEGGPSREGSADLGKRKSDKKRRKGADTPAEGFPGLGEATDAEGAKSLKRTASGMEGGAPSKGKGSKKSKTSKAAAAAEAANDTGQAIAAQRGKKTMIAGDMIEWTAQEDQLLCAIVHEFGQNWALVADVFSNATPVPGVYRKPEHCKLRYRTLTTPGPDGSLEPVVTQLRTVRGASREVLTNAMPVQDAVLNRQLAVLSKVSQNLMVTLAEEKKRKVEANQHRHMMHASHAAVEMKCLQAHNGKHLSALELIDITNQPPVAPIPNQVFAPQQAQQQPRPAAGGGGLPGAPTGAVQPAVAGGLPHPQAQQQAPQPQAGAVGVNAHPGALTAPPNQHLGAAAGQQAHPGMPQAAAAAQPNGVLAATPAGLMQGAAGIMAAASTQAAQALPGNQAGVVMQGGQQPAVIPANLQNSAAFQAALQRQQQQVAQIAQAKQLTPQQQQQLLARLQAQQAQAMAQQQALQSSQAFSTGLMAAAQQPPQQMMQAAVVSQPGMAAATHSSPGAPQQQQMLLPQAAAGMLQGSSPPTGVAQQLQPLTQQQMAGLQQQQQQAVALQQQQQQQQQAAALQQQQQQAALLQQQQGMQPMASQGLLMQQGMQLPGQAPQAAQAPGQTPPAAAPQPNPPAM